MLVLGRLTGEVQDELIEVELQFGMKRFCKPVFAFPLIAAPYTDWVTEYKDKYMGLVGFANNKKGDNLEEALLMGIIPLKDNQTPVETLDQGNVFIMTKNFRLWVDDTGNKYIVDVLNAGEILLGDKNVTEKAMLGDTTVQMLSDIITQILAITVATPAGTSGPPLNAAAFSALQAQLQTLLSQTVKLK